MTSAAGWTYSYDAQNRLTTMQGPGMTITMTYDPLNRVITRNVNGAVTQNVWEGWNLIEEHRPDWSLQRCYLEGANQNEMVAAFDGNVYSNHWYWQDGRGNTSHITGDNAYLLERYTYDLSGAPTFYDEWDNERWGGSVYDTRFLFAGSQYLPETGLYDMRNRFYSPALNRFLQTDPIGFAGDALNLYRYCGDDPVDRSDPMGLEDIPIADIVWQMACHMDSGNSLQGTFQDLMKRLLPAGMGTDAAGDKSIASENEGKKAAGNSKDSAGHRAPSSIRREATSYFVPYKDKNGETLYRAHTVWTLTLLDEHQKPTFGPGIRVDERIDGHSNAVSFVGSGELHNGGDTRPGGRVEDDWRLTFSSLDGKITTQQSIIVGGREAKWEATTNGRGQVEDGSQYWAPFQ
jgi:RHS repeat-associated protein